MEPMEGHGIQAMSVGFLIEADTPGWRGPMVTQASSSPHRDRWRDLDYSWSTCRRHGDIHSPRPEVPVNGG